MAVFEYNHPLISHKLSILRNVETDTKLFRESLNEIASLMIYEATKDLKLKKTRITTPIQETETLVLDEPVTIVPILRAGLGMVDAMLASIPNAKVGHFYAKMPTNVVESKVLIIDPMLATGGSIIYTIDYLKSLGVTNISVLCIIGAPEGVEKVVSHHPDVDLYIASIDKGLNEHKYIYPGLGDAGDRIFGTK